MVIILDTLNSCIAYDPIPALREGSIVALIPFRYVSHLSKNRVLLLPRSRCHFPWYKDIFVTRGESEMEPHRTQSEFKGDGV